MFSFLKSKPVVDETTAQYLTQNFLWLRDNFDRDFFENHTVLVLPTDQYFPDRASSEREMAEALSKRIIGYAGLTQWPFQLVEPQHYAPQTPPLLGLNPQQRNQPASSTKNLPPQAQSIIETSSEALNFSYASAMMKKPMDLVGSISKNIAQHYLMQSQQMPPAGPESFDATAEMLAIFMGFGVMIANSAYTYRAGCGSCNDPRSNRSVSLSEDESIYCLALFCHLKKIDSKQVMPSLKGYLRAPFKQARKQIERANIE